MFFSILGGGSMTNFSFLDQTKNQIDV